MALKPYLKYKFWERKHLQGNHKIKRERLKLTEAEKETLAILADDKLTEEFLKRRKDTLVEMKKGILLDEKDLFVRL